MQIIKYINAQRRQYGERHFKKDKNNEKENVFKI